MRGKIIAALAATLLTITAGVVAQTSGFPSRPIFSKVTIRAGGASGEKMRILSLDAAGDNYLQFVKSDGVTNQGWIGFGSGTNDNFGISNESTGADINILTVGGGDINMLPGGGGVVTVNGSQVPKFAIMGNSNVAGGCTQYGHNAAIQACTRVGVGNYDVDFPASFFSAAPQCTVSVAGATAGWANVLAAAADVNVITRNNAGAATDSHFSLICIGF